jgi:hypothetical protein
MRQCRHKNRYEPDPLDPEFTGREGAAGGGSTGYVPPMLSADAAMRISAEHRRAVPTLRGLTPHRAGLRTGLVSVLKTHFLVILWGVYLLGF